MRMCYYGYHGITMVTLVCSVFSNRRSGDQGSYKRRLAKISGCQGSVERYKMHSMQWALEPGQIDAKNGTRQDLKDVKMRRLFIVCCLKWNIKLEWNIHSVMLSDIHSAKL